jgi:hypothetical protein
VALLSCLQPRLGVCAICRTVCAFQLPRLTRPLRHWHQGQVFDGKFLIPDWMQIKESAACSYNGQSFAMPFATNYQVGCTVPWCGVGGGCMAHRCLLRYVGE